MFFPDVNVLVALTIESHEHSAIAHDWYVDQGRPVLVVCRHTQLGLLRFMTSVKHFPEDAVTNRAALVIYDKLLDAGRLEFRLEPAGLEDAVRRIADVPMKSPKVWSDAYLGAFATLLRLPLVTFDVALAGKTTGSILLRP
ncbi:MAG TPA: TA system VapC family ribonuclease toxin [Terriglobus sp.]